MEINVENISKIMHVPTSINQFIYWLINQSIRESKDVLNSCMFTDLLIKLQNIHADLSTEVTKWHYFNIMFMYTGGFGGGPVGPQPPFFVFSKCFTTNTMILLWKSFYKMLFNSTFRNINVTLLCITNPLTMLYAACPEK